MSKHGGSRPNAGRKTRADEQQLVERLTPLSPKAYSALESGLDEGEHWAVKLWFEYMHGKPNQRLDVNANVEVHKKELPPFMKSNESQS
jgi:hypothetical protein